MQSVGTPARASQDMAMLFQRQGLGPHWMEHSKGGGLWKLVGVCAPWRWRGGVWIQHIKQ